MTPDNKPRDIFVTEFKNQFEVYQLFHAFRNKKKAEIDAGVSGRVIHCREVLPNEANDLAELRAENARLREQVEVSIKYFWKIKLYNKPLSSTAKSEDYWMEQEIKSRHLAYEALEEIERIEKAQRGE